MRALGPYRIVIEAALLAALAAYAVLSVSCDQGGSARIIPAASKPTSASNAPAVALSESSMNFGSQPVDASASPASVTLTNSGGSTLTISSLDVTGTDAANFVETSTCGSSIAAGSKCTVAILFSPKSSGSHSATLIITDNAAGSPHTVALTGAGTHDVILTWKASQSSGIAGYNVFRSTTSKEGNTPLNASAISSTTYLDASVKPGQSYWYWVTSIGSDGTQSPVGAVASATVPSP